MKYSDFLFELGVEELPSKAVSELSAALAVNIKDGLQKASIKHAAIEHFGSPRRMAVLVKDVAHMQDNQKVSRRGPAVAGSLDADNNPKQSLQGFARSCGVAVNELSKVATPKGDWWMYEADLDGKPTKDLLLGIVQESLDKLPIAKLMTWGDAKFNFVRPVHWAIMLFGNDVIPGELFAVKVGRDSYGHRFHHPEAVCIQSSASYVQALHTVKVVSSFATRRALILQQLNALAAEHSLTVIIPDDLLDEVTSIVEWPNAILASFPPEFLEVPEEAIIESLQQHQKCFALKDKHGKLSPHFITIANIVSKKPENVIAGNEKVVKARLSDAAFFYEQDAKQPLANYALAIDKVVFHARLGTLADKVQRMSKIMHYLAPKLSLDVQLAERASLLAKCDLLSGMVGEFPELQGIMGYYYAIKDGESADVAVAIKDHYYPRFAADKLPGSAYGAALSIADRVDNLVGLFAIKQKPTGVKDPFKLRRHALALVRILLSLEHDLSIVDLLKASLDTYAEVVAIDTEEVIESLLAFIFDRMQSYYQTQGIESHYFFAVKAQQSQYFADMDARIQALLHFKQIPEAAALAAACKRVDNILANAKLEHLTLQISEELLTEEAEQSLFTNMLDLEKTVDSLQTANNYQGLLSCLASIKQPLDDFFTNVMVMVDDEQIKLNRLQLLRRLQKLLKTVADIGLINLQ